MKKIALFEIAAWEKDWLIKNLTGFSLYFFHEALDDRHIPNERDFNVISVKNSSLPADILGVFPHLELISVRGRELPSIDFTVCRKRHIMVCRVPVYAVHAVAEFTFALILALSRRFCDIVTQSKKNPKSGSDGIGGYDLYGKALGVLGVGNIGSAVIRIARGFGMKVFAWNPKQNLQLASDLGFTYATAELLVSQSDILTIHLPYIPETKPDSTHKLINREVFARMKPGAFLVNTSHEKIIDSDALVDALRDGVLRGAALDKFSVDDAEKLREQEGVILTPNIAFSTQETFEQILQKTAENIRAYFKGFPQNAVGESFPEKL